MSVIHHVKKPMFSLTKKYIRIIRSQLFPSGTRKTKWFQPGYSMLGILLFSSCQLIACSAEPENKPAADNSSESRQQKSQKQESRECLDCHDYKPDPIHEEIECAGCHQGQSPAPSRQKAHNNLVGQPSHPDHMAENCGGCHSDLVKRNRTSAHFTLAGEINTVRQAYGANSTIANLKEIPVADSPATPLELADDLLRRRCLHCHVYWPGDPYSETLHGTGCAACHLEYRAGELESHKFLAQPTDQQCLHCHYGNHVGADYYGLYEHDFHWAYRTPYRRDGLTPDRPYGVENHQLSPDIHQEAGLACIDCHNGRELMSDDPEAGISCLSCHQKQNEEAEDRDNLELKDGRLLLTTKMTGEVIEVPSLKHPAHEKYQGKISCHACHSKWSYNDVGTHLIRLDIQDYEPWGNLEVQSNFEAEAQITDALYGAGEYPYPFMQDKITGQSSRGLWLKSFELRRWESPVYCRDELGVLQVCRPVLDLHLSWVNQEEEVIFDAVTPEHAPDKGLLPYAPHTIGHAGPFFRQRLQENSNILQEPYFLDNRYMKNRDGEDDNPNSKEDKK